jgi:CO/xanthine dehydrogenase Mo-binding subunit
MTTSNRRPSTVDSAEVGRSRRDVLKLGGLGIAFLWLGSSRSFAAINARQQPEDAAAAVADGAPPFAPNAFIRIGTDGLVRLVMPNAEMGQSIYTGTALLLAEELGVDLDQVSVQHSPANAALYGMPFFGGQQVTAASASTRNDWQILREAGAVARTLLVEAAAARWNVEPASCQALRGEVSHPPSGRRLSYGELAEAAGKLPMPAEVTLKAPTDFRLIGKPWRRLDANLKVDGRAKFGIDAQVPGMKIATIKACPTFGGRLASVDASATRKILGVIDIVELNNAVAVIGEHFWAAKEGLDSLVVTWDHGENVGLDSAQLTAILAEQSEAGTPIVARQSEKLRANGKKVEAVYQLPLLAHAAMEPLNCTVSVASDRCEVWVGTQAPTRVAEAIAKVVGMSADKIVVHNHYLGGGFGRRAEVDSVIQAAEIAKRVKYPVKLIWTREEDIRHDIPRPMYYDRISANLDERGYPASWYHRTTGASIVARWAPLLLTKEGLDTDLVDGAADTPYGLPNLQSEWVRCDMPSGLDVGWWRGVGPNHNLYVVESFLDELAYVAGEDPLAYRQHLLTENPRMRAVLDLAADKIDWGKDRLPARVGRGIALGEPFGSRVCAIVEASVSRQGLVELRRVVISIDCGLVINPSTVEAQAQGGVLFGLSAALFNELTIKNGAVEQSNFHDYRTLRINETPQVEVYQIKSTEPPGGMGEVCTAIAAPALNNAIFAATGVRLRQLPIDNEALIAKGAAREVIGATSPARVEGQL